MAHTLVAYAIPHDQILRSVNRHPAVVRINDGNSLHHAAPHRFADKVIVNRISSEDAFFAKMGKSSIANPAFAEAVIDRVTTHAFWIGAFNNHVPRQIGDLATEFAASGMSELQGFVQCDRTAIDCCDGTFFRLWFFVP